jgi:hypothetical protein
MSCSFVALLAETFATAAPVLVAEVADADVAVADVGEAVALAAVLADEAGCAAAVDPHAVTMSARRMAASRAFIPSVQHGRQRMRMNSG